jgi:hypothetical protein
MTKPADLIDVALRLRAIAREDGFIPAAQVRLIGLDEIREAAGARWSAMREKVRAGSLGILTRHAASADVIVPAGDGFLVVLAEGAPGEYQARCNKMREALLSYYLGEDALKTLRPVVTQRSLTVDGFADLMTTGADDHAPTPSAKPGQHLMQVRVFSAAERGVVAHWFCPARLERGERRLAYNPDFILDGTHHDQSYLDLDIALFERALAHLSVLADEKTAVGFTAHASTMHTRKSRESYLSALSHIPHDLRARATVTIAEIEKGAPLISIAEWCTSLRSIVGRVCLDFHYSDHAIASIGGAGAYAAGFHLPIYTGAQKGPRASYTLEQIRFWARGVHNQSMRLAVNGFRDAAFFSQAISAGLDIATSDTLWPFKALDADVARAV